MSGVSYAAPATATRQRSLTRAGHRRVQRPPLDICRSPPLPGIAAAACIAAAVITCGQATTVIATVTVIATATVTVTVSLNLAPVSQSAARHWNGRAEPKSLFRTLSVSIFLISSRY